MALLQISGTMKMEVSLIPKVTFVYDFSDIPDTVKEESCNDNLSLMLDNMFNIAGPVDNSPKVKYHA